MGAVGQGDVPDGVLVLFAVHIVVADDHVLVHRGIAAARDGREPGDRAGIDDGGEFAVTERSGVTFVIAGNETAGGDAGDVHVDRGSRGEPVESAVFAAVRKERAAVDDVLRDEGRQIVVQVVAVDKRRAVDDRAVFIGGGIGFEIAPVGRAGGNDAPGGRIVVRHQPVVVVPGIDDRAAEAFPFDRLEEIADSVRGLEEDAFAAGIALEVDSERTAVADVGDGIGGDVPARAEREGADAVKRAERGFAARSHADAVGAAFRGGDAADGVGAVCGAGDRDGGAVAEDEGADGDAVVKEADGGLAERVGIGEDAAGDEQRVVFREMSLSDIHVAEGVDAPDEEFAVADGAGNAFVPGAVQVDVARVLGHEVQGVFDISVVINLKVAVDRHDGLFGLETVGNRDGLRRAVVVRRVDRDGACGQVAEDGQLRGSVNRDGVRGQVVGNDHVRDVAADHDGVEVDHGAGDVGVDDGDAVHHGIRHEIRGEDQGAGAADIAPGAADRGGDFFFDKLRFRIRIVFGGFRNLIDRRDAEPAACDFDAGVAGNVAVAVGDRDFVELAGGDGQVDGRDRGTFIVRAVHAVVVGAADDRHGIAVGIERFVAVAGHEEVCVCAGRDAGVHGELGLIIVAERVGVLVFGEDEGVGERGAVVVGRDRGIVEDVAVLRDEEHALCQAEADRELVFGVADELELDFVGLQVALGDPHSRRGDDHLVGAFVVADVDGDAVLAGGIAFEEVKGVRHVVAVGALTVGEFQRGVGVDHEVVDHDEPGDAVVAAVDVDGPGAFVDGAVAGRVLVSVTDAGKDAVDRGAAQMDREVRVAAAFCAVGQRDRPVLVAVGTEPAVRDVHLNVPGIERRTCEVVAGAVAAGEQAHPLVGRSVHVREVDRHLLHGIERAVIGVTEGREIVIESLAVDIEREGRILAEVDALRDGETGVRVEGSGTDEIDRDVAVEGPAGAVVAAVDQRGVGLRRTVVVDGDGDVVIDHMSIVAVVAEDDGEAGLALRDDADVLERTDVAGLDGVYPVRDEQRAAVDEHVVDLRDVDQVGGRRDREGVDAEDQGVAGIRGGAGDVFRESRIDVDAGQVEQIDVVALRIDVETGIAGEFSAADAGLRADDPGHVAFLGRGGTGDVDRAAAVEFDIVGGQQAGGRDRDLSDAFDAADRNVAVDRDRVSAVARDHAVDRDAVGQGEVAGHEFEVFFERAAGDGQGVVGSAERGRAFGERAECVEAVFEIRPVIEDHAGDHGGVFAVHIGIGLDRAPEHQGVALLDDAVLVRVCAGEGDVRGVEAGDAAFRGKHDVRAAGEAVDVDDERGAGEIEAGGRDFGVGRELDGREVRDLAQSGFGGDVDGGGAEPGGAGEDGAVRNREGAGPGAAHHDRADRTVPEVDVVVFEVLGLERTAGYDDRAAPVVRVGHCHAEVGVGVVAEQEFLPAVECAVDRIGVGRVDVHVVGLVEHVDALQLAAAEGISQLALSGQVVVADDRDVAQVIVGVDLAGSGDHLVRTAFVAGHVDDDLRQGASVVQDVVAGVADGSGGELQRVE